MSAEGSIRRSRDRDVARIDPDDVAETYPDVPLLGFTNHKDTEGLRRAHAAGFDRVVVKSALFERSGEVIDALLRPSTVDWRSAPRLQ